MSRVAVLDVDADSIGRLLHEAYGMVADTIDIVSGEAASVSRVSVQAHDYAAKIARATSEAEELIGWQAGVVQQLADAKLPVARVVPDLSGSLTHSARIGTVGVIVQLSRWLPDPPLAEVLVDRSLLHDVGRTARQVCQALTAAPRPPHAVSHPWELSRSADSILAALHDVEDGHTRELADEAAHVFDETIGRRIDELPRALVHHDLHDSNLLVGHDAVGRRAVTGILDFDDMVVGLRIAELSVAAAYAARHCADPVTAYLDVVTGWGADSDLSDAEIFCLFPAGMARLAVNAAVWASRFDGPRGDYARRRSAATVTALEQFVTADRDTVTQRIAEALRAH